MLSSFAEAPPKFAMSEMRNVSAKGASFLRKYNWQRFSATVVYALIL
jgi:hypothetical protein